MLRVCVLVGLVAVTLGLTTELNEHWQLFKTTYNKNYLTHEESNRRELWEAAVKMIREHNLEYDMGKHTYTLGLNQYADMTNEEFRSQMNGYRMASGPRNSTGTYMSPNGVNLPDSVDWRPKGYVTDVKNQLQCGSCWAFSTTGSLEGQHFKKTQKLVSLSEQNLVDCSTKQGNHGCQGGLMDYGFTYIKTNGGIDTEQSYPYTAKNGQCKFSAGNVGATDTGYMDIKSGSEGDLQSAVATVGPIAVAIDASHMSFQLYKSGVYHSWFCSSKKLDHGVLAVGYGTQAGIFGKEDYWIVKNSWGKTWGEAGYLKMSRNRNNNCGIATQASYPLV